MRRPTAPLTMSDEHREVLEKLCRSQIAAHRDVQRARALLLAGDGVANTRIAAAVGVSPATVKAWRERFSDEGLTAFGGVRPGRGRKPSIGPQKVAEIVRATLHDRPEGQTHWSCRSMAKAQGVSPATVQRIWSARAIKPHRVKTFELSNDTRFEDKLVDVVGLYLNPPENAVVLCMDEKSQIQALDRTQPSLPIKKGRAGTMTHDSKRNGTTTLFAALDVLTGAVIGQCLPRHRHVEFVKLFAHDRPRGPQGPADPSDPRQLRNAQARQRQDVAGQAPALSSALHADLELVGQPRRAVLWHAHRQGDPPRRLSVRARPDRRDRRLPPSQQPRPRAVCMDRDRRLDPAEGPPQTHHPRRNHQPKPRHNTRPPSAAATRSPGSGP